MTKEENAKRIERLKNIVLNMPDKPGSYQFYDTDHTIIYVGKAKRLKQRVSSYFHKEVDRFKTKVLVSNIEDISYTVVNTEEDALLLENSLIKKYNPRYNVLLKDGKTYPSICVTNEYLPRVFKTRQINKRFGTFFGPYSHTGSMFAVLELIHKLYKPRTCRMIITKEGIEQGKYKPCLEYHIHNCKAPCCGKQSLEDYQAAIAQAREILKGNTRELSKHIYEEMQKKAAELKFEEAEELKQKYILIENFCAKSEVVSHTITDVDVFSIIDDEAQRTAFINYIHVKNGSVNQSFTFEYKRKLDETDQELLLTAIPEIRERFQSHAKEIIVPFEMEWQLSGATFFVPQRGDKKHLLELGEMNCRQYKFDRLKQAEKLNPEQKQTRLMKELQQKLHLEKLPYQIECFDNSNISGTDAVAGCIVFKGMKPSKKDYRKYNIKTVVGPDDYASMQEVARPYHYGRWIGSDERGARGCRRRIRAEYPYCRTRKGRPSPHQRTALRQSSADHCAKDRLRTLPYPDANPGRGAPLRHTIPSRQAIKARPSQCAGRDSRHRSCHTRQAAQDVQERETHPRSNARRVSRSSRHGEGKSHYRTLRSEKRLREHPLNEEFL